MQISLFRKSVVLVQKSRVRTVLYTDTLKICGFDVMHTESLDNVYELIKSTDILMIDDDVATEKELFSVIKRIFLANTPVPIILISNKEVPQYISNMLYTVFSKSSSVSNLTECVLKYSEQELYGA